MTDNHLPNKKFIVDSIITDYRLGKQEIRLIEKKGYAIYKNKHK